jgi:hypothetical protein
VRFGVGAEPIWQHGCEPVSPTHETLRVAGRERTAPDRDRGVCGRFYEPATTRTDPTPPWMSKSTRFSAVA